MNPDRFTQAKEFYTNAGFKYIDVPYTVDEEISNITKPPQYKNFFVGNKVLVASAEQSFLQMIRDKELENDITKTPSFYCAITPCFRDEVIDELHKQYFMKLELIALGGFNEDVCLNIIELAQYFLQRFIHCKVIETDPGCFDIVSKKRKIELGSYGVREHPLVGRWMYATGLAEPRLTYAIGKEKE